MREIVLPVLLVFGFAMSVVLLVLCSLAFALIRISQ